MPSLAEMLGFITQPMYGGPAIPILPKAQNNATAGGIPAVPGPKGQPLSSPSELMNALTAIGNARYENELRQAKAEEARRSADLYKSVVRLSEYTPTMGGGGEAASPATAPVATPAAWGSIAPPDTGGRIAGDVSRGDPVEHFLDLAERDESGGRNILQQVVGPKGGYNPSVGRVTGPSSAQGYFQIINPTWKAFAPQAGVDLEQYPSAMSAPYDVQRRVARTIATTDGVQHWTDYNKTLRANVERAGLPVSGPIAGDRTGMPEQLALPAVPNFAGMMAGNQGPAYAPPGGGGALPPDTVVGAAAPAGIRPVADASGQIPGYPSLNLPRQQADLDYITGRGAAVPSGAPMSLAPGMTGVPQPPASGVPRYSPQDIAMARQIEILYPKFGLGVPTWAKEAAEMGPGGSKSPEYLGAVAATKKWAEVAPELFTQTQLKKVQAGLDLSLKEKQAMLDRASDDQKQRLTASLDVVPVTVRLPDGGTEERLVTRSELAAGVASPARTAAGAQAAPAQQTLPSGAVIAGKPTGIGPIAPDYRLVTPPEGGAPRQERILGSPAAQAAEQSQGQAQQGANIMKEDIGRVLERTKGGWANSWSGMLLKDLPGTDAFNARILLKPIEANISFDRITQMRNSSQSGAALGAVSDRDLDLLRSTMGNLELAQDKKEFEWTLRRLGNIYNDVINGSPDDLEKAVKDGKLSRSQFDQAIARREKERYSEDTEPAPKSQMSPGGVEWRIK